MATLFERLSRGRPSAEEPIRQPRRRDDQRAFLLDVLVSGPVPVTRIEERGAAHGFSKKQLIYAKQHMGIVVFKEAGRRNGRWFWCLGR